MAASCTYYLPTIISNSTRAIKKSQTFNDLKKRSFLERKSQGNGPLAENDKSQKEPED